MASVGSLKPLVEMLKESPSLAGASVAFGEEMIYAQDAQLPYVVVVPGSGSYKQGQGYIKDADTNLDIIWGVDSQIDLYLWAHSEDPAAEPIDHADAVENFRAAVLQALQYQRPNGLYYRPVVDRWELANSGVSRFGRVLILTVLVEISIPDSLPPLATVTSVDPLTVSITPAA